jgi:hypothetical protein
LKKVILCFKNQKFYAEYNNTLVTKCSQKKLKFKNQKKLGLSQIWTFKNGFLIKLFWEHFVTKEN